MSRAREFKDRACPLTCPNVWAFARPFAAASISAGGLDHFQSGRGTGGLPRTPFVTDAGGSCLM